MPSTVLIPAALPLCLAGAVACAPLQSAEDTADCNFVQLGIRLTKPQMEDPMSYQYTGSGASLQSSIVDYHIEFQSAFMFSAVTSFNLFAGCNAQVLAASNADDPRERQLMGALGFGRLYTMIEMGSNVYRAEVKRGNAAPVVLEEDGRTSYTQVALGVIYGDEASPASLGVAYRQITWPMVIRIKDTRATGKAAEGSSDLDTGTEMQSFGVYFRADTSVSHTAHQREHWYGITDFYLAAFSARMSDALVRRVQTNYGGQVEGTSYEGYLASVSMEFGYHLPVRLIDEVRSGLLVGPWFQTDYFISTGTDQRTPTQNGHVRLYPDDDGLYGRFVYGVSARLNAVW